MPITWTDALELLSRQKRLTWSALPAELSVAIAEAILTHDAGRLAPRGEPPAMDLIDRYAAAAPPVPEWFTWNRAPDEPQPIDRNAFVAARIGERPPNFPMPNEAALASWDAAAASLAPQVLDAVEAVRRDREAWTQRDLIGREAQWRWTFAEAMLAERGRRRERWDAEAMLQQLRDEDAAPDDAPELD